MLRFNSHVMGLPRVTAMFAVMAVAVIAMSSLSNAQQQPATVGHVSVAPNDLDAVFGTQACNTSKALSQFDAPIARMSKRIEAHEPVLIVALGSSSTAGSGASSPAFSYPSRLARELANKFPHAEISVVNRGINGEEASDMMKRLDDVLQTKPDLVLWQVGTNAVLRDHDVAGVRDVLQVGITRIKDSGSDVLLIDPQFAPAVNNKTKTAEMIGAIGGVAKRMHVALFRRYSAMRHWNEDQAIGFDRFIMPDGVHMNDWGYSCFARLLADNIATAVTRSRTVADVKPLQ